MVAEIYSGIHAYPAYPGPAVNLRHPTNSYSQKPLFASTTIRNTVSRQQQIVCGTACLLYVALLATHPASVVVPL